MKNFILITGLFLIAACGTRSSTETVSEESTSNSVELTNAQRVQAAIVTDTITYRNMSSVIRLTGKVDVPPQNIVSISMPLGGYLKSTRLLPGMHVRLGETIAVLEDAQYIQLQQDYLITKAKLQYAEAEYKRQKDLNADKSSSDKVLQQATTEYESLQVTLGALAEKLRLININPASINASNISRSISLRAPIDGFVSSVNVNIGKYVTPSDVLFELVNPSDIHLSLTVFEKDINELYIGQRVYAYTNKDTAAKHLCEIILINKDLTNEGTAQVHCHFLDYDKNLLPGMFMNAVVQLQSDNVAAVPEQALVNYQGKTYIFSEAGNNQYNMMPVQTGISEGGYTEILNATNFTGKKIVVKNAYTLLMATKNKAEE